MQYRGIAKERFVETLPCDADSWILEHGSLIVQNNKDMIIQGGEL